MMHPKQFLEKAARAVALGNGVPVAEARECQDRHAVLLDWWQASLPWLARGAMSGAWWNAVLNEPLALALVKRWAKDYPSDAQTHGHARALAERLAP